MFLLTEINSLERILHSSVVVGDNAFVWGGAHKNLPVVHDNPEKRQFTSTVETFNMLTGKWEKRQTTGSPPNGAIASSYSKVGNNIYYFGGMCKPYDCFHNNLFVLNTTTNKWKEVKWSDDNRPIRKIHCGMISFSSGGEDYLLVIGGYGPVPANAPVHSQYIFDDLTLNTDNPSNCCTNEIHLMCVSSSPGSE